MTNPLQTLRDALAEANSALGWASSMLIEGVEFYTVREVLHAAQKDALKCYKALTRAESALREIERDDATQPCGHSWRDMALTNERNPPICAVCALHERIAELEAALRELECRRVTWDAVPGAEGYAVSVGDPEPRYTVEEVLGALDELDPSDCVLAAEYLRDGGWVSPADFIKRRLADRGEKNG